MYYPTKAQEKGKNKRENPIILAGRNHCMVTARHASWLLLEPMKKSVAPAGASKRIRDKLQPKDTDKTGTRI